MVVHLIKLCVGCDTVEELLAWRHETFAPGTPWILRTRQTPKRADELVGDGSLYRVFKGSILCRQKIAAVETVGAGPNRRCEIHLEDTVILTLPTLRRPFQGWRYLDPADAPADLNVAGSSAVVPPDLARRLRELGAW